MRHAIARRCVLAVTVSMLVVTLLLVVPTNDSNARRRQLTHGSSLPDYYDALDREERSKRDASDVNTLAVHRWLGRNHSTVCAHVRPNVPLSTSSMCDGRPCVSNTSPLRRWSITA